MTDGITAAHDEVETLRVDVNIPEHEKREGASSLFRHSRDDLIEREGGRCWVCGMTAEETGHPLEAHHSPLERSFAEMIDFKRLSVDCKAGLWGPYAAAFDWDSFLSQPDIYLFVDDMRVNGLLLCKNHHTVGNEGIHTLPAPIFLAQRYGKEGYKFTDKEIIHHDI